MNSQLDVEAMEPALELWLDHAGRPPSLRCVGVLCKGTRHAVLDAVSTLLAGGIRELVVDVTGLRIDDAVGAGTLTEVQRSARDAGVALSWRGLAARHFTQGLTGPGPAVPTTRWSSGNQPGRTSGTLPDRAPGTGTARPFEASTGSRRPSTIG